MAGSYSHVVDEEGALLPNLELLDMIDSGGDTFETIEQMYGMIWELADVLLWEIGTPGDSKALAEIVERALENYKEGLSKSPTQRYKE